MSDVNQDVDTKNISLTKENIPIYMELLRKKKEAIMALPQLSQQHFLWIVQIDEMLERLSDELKKLKSQQIHR